MADEEAVNTGADQPTADDGAQATEPVDAVPEQDAAAEADAPTDQIDVSPEAVAAAAAAEAADSAQDDSADVDAGSLEVGALGAVNDIESQLGDVLSSLDDLAIGEGAMGELSPGQAADGGAHIDLLRDVELNVKIELGRSRMYIEDILKLGEGSVVELDKLAGDPVDVFVNDRLVARGEVLVLNDNFCVRIGEIISQD